MKALDPNSLVPLNAFTREYPIRIDVVYAQENHPDNHFPKLYHPGAQVMWAHKDLAAITLVAARMCAHFYGWTLKLNDCLRPVEAQEKMARYGFHPSLVSVPGSGAHPRAMAIDIEPLDANGDTIPMGTPFDYFSADPENFNPAARHFTQFEGTLEDINEVCINRHKLEIAMRIAATSGFGKLIWPLPQEWWDFRFTEEVFNAYAPLREKDLHPYQRMIDADVKGIEQIMQGRYPDAVQRSIDEVYKTVRDVFSKIPLTSPAHTLKTVHGQRT